MSALYPVLLIAIPALLLAALLWWVYAGKRKERLVRESAVAESNHESVRKFHYGPAPVPEPLAAAPPLAPDSLLNQLLPAEDFKEREESAEAARVEAEQMAEREAAQVPVPIEAGANESASIPADEPTSGAPVIPAEEPAPVLRSSRHAPGAAINVFDVLALVGNDAPAVADGKASEPAPADAAAEAASPQSEAAAATLEEEPVAEAIYDNPVSAARAAPTENDAANTQASVTLRQRNRAALQARLDAQRNAMSVFTTDTKKPR